MNLESFKKVWGTFVTSLEFLVEMTQRKIQPMCTFKKLSCNQVERLQIRGPNIQNCRDLRFPFGDFRRSVILPSKINKNEIKQMTSTAGYRKFLINIFINCIA